MNKEQEEKRMVEDKKGGRTVNDVKHLERISCYRVLPDRVNRILINGVYQQEETR